MLIRKFRDFYPGFEEVGLELSFDEWVRFRQIKRRKGISRMVPKEKGVRALQEAGGCSKKRGCNAKTPVFISSKKLGH